jgi:hypothetical protein
MFGHRALVLATVLSSTAIPARADIAPDTRAPGCLWKIDGIDEHADWVFFAYPQDGETVGHLVAGELHDPGKGEFVPLLHAAPVGKAPANGSHQVSLAEFGELPYVELGCVQAEAWLDLDDPVHYIARHYRIDSVGERIAVTHIADLAVSGDKKTVFGPWEPPAPKPAPEANEPLTEPIWPLPWIVLAVVVAALLGGILLRRRRA